MLSSEGYNMHAMPEYSDHGHPSSTVQALPADLIDSRDIVDHLNQIQRDIADKARSGALGVALARQYSDCLDAVVTRLCEVCAASVGFDGPLSALPMSIVATGGYGRRELCPHSDLDITFIPARDGDPAIDRLVKVTFSALMNVLMDGAKIEVGYAYRLIEDCGNLDHQTVSGLLDARLVAGNARLFIRFEGVFWDTFNPAEFIFAKLEERRAQRIHAGGTPRTVEPQLKTGPGGLRDLQTAVWLIQARDMLHASSLRGDRCWEAIQRAINIRTEDIAALRSGKETLFMVRNALHAIAGQERDQLTVSRQEEIAQVLGYRQADGTPDVEQLMRELYGCLGDIARITCAIETEIENSRLVMGLGLDCVDRCLCRSTPALPTIDTAWPIWAGVLAQRFDLGFTRELREAMLDTARSGVGPNDPIYAGTLLTQILSSGRPIYPLLQTLAEIGVLGWILPEFGITLNLIPYDASHEYTVGQHTLYVVQYLDELRIGPCPEEHREFAAIMGELNAPEHLYMAALYHDVGKYDPNNPHWETGADLAEAACRRLGWDDDAVRSVVFLVRHHLLMSEYSRLRDLSLDETIREFTSVVDNIEMLRMLYVLTYADTRAVSSGLWTQIKARYLKELYRRAESALELGLPDGSDDALVIRTRRRLARELRVADFSDDEIAAHLEVMPADYVLNTSREDLTLHIAFIHKARQGKPSISFIDDRQSTFTELTICTLDDPQPGLLAKVAGVLLASDLTVHAAQVFTHVTNGEQIALDTLYVDYRGRRLSPGKRKEVETNLELALNGRALVEEILAKNIRHAESPPILEQVQVRRGRHDRFTAIEMAFSSPRGILYYASKAISELRWDINSARMALFRGRAMATFYVSGVSKIADTTIVTALTELLQSRV